MDCGRIQGKHSIVQVLARKNPEPYKIRMEPFPWTHEHLSMAVDAYLALLANQQAGGALTAEAAVRVASSRTGRSEKACRRVMEAVTWLLEEHGARSCKSFRPLCNVAAETLALLEHILSMDWKVDRTMHRQQWTRSELKAAVVAYRAMVQDEAAGKTVDAPARIDALAKALSRKFSAVRLRMNNIAWIMAQTGKPVASCVPQLSGVGRKVVSVVLDVWQELDAEDRGAPDEQAPWTESQLRTALDAYREVAAIDPARAPVEIFDCICHLAQQTGRRFAPSRRCLGWIAWLVQERGGTPPACLEPSEDMPAETRAILGRLLDGGWGG